MINLKSHSTPKVAPPEKGGNLQEKFVLNYKKYPIIDVKVIHELIRICNIKKYGPLITLHEVVAYFVENHSQADIKAIQEKYLSDWDKIVMRYEKAKKEKDFNLTLHEFIAKKMKIV